MDKFEAFDPELKEVMGSRYHGEPKKVEESINEPVGETRNWEDRLKAAVKHTLIFGGLFYLVLHWGESGMLAPEAAIPSMNACALLLGWNLGRDSTK